MPDEGFKARLKPVQSAINKMLKDRGVEWALCGGKRDRLPNLNPATGYWSNPAESNKAPRWIIHFKHVGSEWIARLPEVPGVDRIGAFNTANRLVSGIGVLPLPAVKRGDEYQFLTDWSWLLWFVFPKALPNGSSAQLVDGFDPAKGTLKYLDSEVRYVAAGLVMLLAPTVTEGGKPPLTYEQATHALAALIHVTPDRALESHA